jgi:hypothetical protein
MMGTASIAASAPQPSGLRLEGTYEYSLYVGAPQPSFKELHTFRAAISQCSWIIEYYNTAGATNLALPCVHRVASCDGTNIYLVELQAKSAGILAWGEKWTPSLGQENAGIKLGFQDLPD